MGPKIIAHICNDVGAWGKGFVVAISARWLVPEASYRDWHRDRETNDFQLGAVQIVPVSDGLFIANMIGQAGLRKAQGVPPIRYEAVDACLNRLAELAGKIEASVHMPRIGCGLAGGTWDRIEPLIVHRLSDRGIPVWVYDLPPLSPTIGRGWEKISRTRH
jgi:O-acetyl-ADP-ribose deacetylase (regulator of RNase III)